MPSFSWNNSVPFSTNNPSDDQPEMLSNTQSINSILNVDHYSFESSTAAGDSDGYHKHIHYPVPVALGAPALPASAHEYTELGTADPARPNLIYRTDRAPFPLNSIRAMGVFSLPNTNPMTFINQFNVVSGAFDGSNYDITLATNAVIGTTPCVIICTDRGLSFRWSMTGANVLRINNLSVANSILSFIVLQV